MNGSLHLNRQKTRSRSNSRSIPTFHALLMNYLLLEKARHAKNGEHFWALWNGDTSDYLSASEADAALCAMVAFWTGKDAQRMDRLF